MAVINISVTESPIQKVAGIPESIILDTNIPSTIFYTLDGSDPTINSKISIGSITLPTNQVSVTVKAFATNGIDSCPIVTFFFAPNVLNNTRFPHSKTTGGFKNKGCAFGSPNISRGIYSQPAGITVDSINFPGIPDGYDGTATGTPAGFTDKPYNLENYEIVYSTTNNIGETGRGIGTLPANVEFIVPDPINKSNQATSRFFDPKAPVIVQDGRKTNENPDLSLLNRQFFSLGDFERIRDGASYRNTGYDGSVPTGSFIKAFYNPRESTYTFYYRDSETNRWIISIEPISKPQNNEALRQLTAPRTSRVFEWIPFKRKIIG